jgi:hypothetical protein
MAYKNSDSNTGYQAQYYNWKYFNSSLQKLGDYKPRNINLSTTRPPVKEEINWVEVASGAMKMSMDTMDVLRKDSEEEADKFLQSHSLEQYKDLMQKKEVPFQNNPLAMAALEERVGKVTSGLAIEAFQDSIKNDPDFWKLPAEQQDARMLQFMEEQVADFTKLYGYTDNYWYRKGFFENTLPKRIETILKAKDYRETQLKQQDYMTSMAEVGKMVNDPNISGKTIASYIANNNTVSGHYKSPQEQVQAIETVMKQLSGSRYGYQKLLELGEETVPNTDIKYKDFIGIDKYEAYKIQSQTLAEASQRKELFDLKVSSNQLAEEGKATELYGNLVEAYKRSGGADNEEVKILQASYMKAEQVNKRLKDQAAKEQQLKAMEDLKVDLVLGFTQKGARASMNDITDLKDTFGVSGAEFRKIYKQLLDSNAVTPQMHDALALNKSIPESENPALQLNKTVVNGAMSSVERLTDGLFYKTDVPPQDIPQEVAEGVKLFQRIGYSNFAESTGASSDVINTLEAISRAQQEGRPYTDVLKNRVADKVKQEQDKTYDRKRTFEIQSMLQQGVFTGVDYPLDGRAMAGIVESTVAKMKANGWDSKKAGQEAYDEFWNNNYSVLGATVPKTLFTPANGFPEGSIDYLKKHIKTDFADGKTEGLQGFFNPESQSFSVVDAGTLEVIKGYTVKELRELANKEHKIDLMQRQVDKYGMSDQVKKDMEKHGFELDENKQVKLKGESRRVFKEWSKRDSTLHDHEVDLTSNTGTGD